MEIPSNTIAVLRALIFAVPAALSTDALAEGDPDKGRSLAQGSVCTRCHGVDGNARSTSFQVVPMLAGQPAAYLVQEMNNYASGTRVDSSKNGQMAKELRLLNGTDFEDIAAYYEAQKRY